MVNELQDLCMLIRLIDPVHCFSSNRDATVTQKAYYVRTRYKVQHSWL